MGAEPPIKITRASVELQRILDEGGPTANAVKDSFARMSLYRWSKGKRQPDREPALRLEGLTRGRITIPMWSIPAADADITPTRRRAPRQATKKPRPRRPSRPKDEPRSATA